MYIVFNRTKEDSQSIMRMKKNLTLKVPQRKIFLCTIIGFGFFIYGDDVIGETVFSGYALVGMLFLGGAAMLYLEKFYPKLSSSPIEIIENYKRNENDTYNFKVELTDSHITYDTAGINIKVDWSCIKSFKIHKGDIFLLRSNTISIPSFVIKQRELTRQQYVEFCDFLNEKLLNDPANQKFPL